MTDREPVVRRAEPPSPQKLILWGIGAGDLVMLGLLIFIFDEFGFFQEAWGWPVLIGIAVIAAIQFYVLRRILLNSARAKPAHGEE